MNTIDHAFRLLDTQQAGLSVLLAAAAVAAAFVIALIYVVHGRVRWMGAFLIVATGLATGGATVEASYYSWYRHRCVLHSSDIPECFGEDGKRLHDEGY